MQRVAKFNLVSKSLLAVAILATSTVAVAAGDATLIPASPITNTTVQEPSATVLAPTVNTATLPTCPNPIRDCPDINGAGGNAATCPDNCKVSRTLNPNPAYNAAYSGFVPAVLNVSPAACPVGYFAGQTFDPQPDYAYMSPGPQSPVTQAVYNFLGPSQCKSGAATKTTQGNPTNCGLSPGQPCCNYGNPCAGLVGNGQVYTGATTGCYRSGSNTIDLETGLFTVVSQNYSWTNCGGSCAGGCIQGTWMSTDNYNYTISMIQCTPKPGYYPTGNTINSSVVCTRSKTQWKQLNQ